MSGPARVVASFAAGAAAALAGLAALDHADRGRDPRPGDDDRWHRHNHAGVPVTLYGGAAATAGVLAGLTVAVQRDRRASPDLVRDATGVALAGVFSAAVAGWYDDARTVHPAERGTKGLTGHLAALRRGVLSAGAVKVVGIGAGALAGAVAAHGPTPDAVLTAGVVAGAAHVTNLLDLRPGRAAKAVAAACLPVALTPGAGRGVAAATLGAVAAVVPADLAGRTMLGDLGAGTLGAATGAALAARAGRAGRLATFAALAALTVASERVSFSAVIDRQPVLRRLDRLGRGAAAPAAAR